MIRYIAPLENNQGFFVPEVAQKEEREQERAVITRFHIHALLRIRSPLLIGSSSVIKQMADHTYFHSHTCSNP